MCVTVCVCVTRQIFFVVVIYLRFLFLYSVVCMIEKKKAVSRYSQEADATSLT